MLRRPDPIIFKLSVGAAGSWDARIVDVPSQPLNTSAASAFGHGFSERLDAFLRFALSSQRLGILRDTDARWPSSPQLNRREDWLWRLFSLFKGFTARGYGTLNDGLLEINSVGIFSTFFRRQSLGYNADSALFPSFKRFCGPGAHRSPDSLARASVANAGLFQFTLSWSMDLETFPHGWLGA
jgi:hypothetical protein